MESHPRPVSVRVAHLQVPRLTLKAHARIHATCECGGLSRRTPGDATPPPQRPLRVPSTFGPGLPPPSLLRRPAPPTLERPFSLDGLAAAMPQTGFWGWLWRSFRGPLMVCPGGDPARKCALLRPPLQTGYLYPQFFLHFPQFSAVFHKTLYLFLPQSV